MISIISTFTADPVVPLLQWLVDRLELNQTVQLAPYGQIFQELISETSASRADKAGVALLVLRADDLVRNLEPQERTEAALLQLVDELAAAVTGFASGRKSPTCWALLPSSGPHAAAGERRLRDALAGHSSVIEIEPAAIARYVDLAATADPRSDEIAHIPYSDVGFAGLALVLARAAHATLRTAHKVLVLDCDNTIWEGVVGEDGVSGIGLTPPFLALQRFAADIQRQGVLICLASKNIDQDVVDVFDQRTDMALTLDQVVSRRVNWQPKVLNIRELASELNLGLDAFVFIDDNPVEVGQVREQLPQVTSLLLPKPERMEAFVANLWMFDKPRVTDEDVRRTQMYRENQERQKLESSANDIGAFIASLQLQIDLEQPQEGEWPRVAQLTERTNQFNFTTRRRTEAEVRAFAAAGGQSVLRVKVRDRFGDYGLVGVMMSRQEGDRLSVDNFMLSCRVLGRGVEHGMLRHLAKLGEAGGAQWLDVTVLPTAKNEPARAFMESVGKTWQTIEPDSGTILYRIPIADALKITHIPGQDPEAVMKAARAGDGGSAKAAAPAAQQRPKWSLYQDFTTGWTDAREFLETVQASSRVTRQIEGQVAEPQNDTERRLLAIWQRVLNIDVLGIDDPFESLGGTSLAAARIFADIEEQFGQRLRLTTILTKPTIRSLAALLESGPVGTAPSDSLIRLGDSASQTLFLVHDGDGETLLYRNLAQQLAQEMSVVGIEPLAKAGIPLAHDSVEAMAEHYVGQLKTLQPAGPYRLGGMCAGGVIAYEMARQLAQRGDKVDFVVVMDAAAPSASRRDDLLTRQRSGRLEAMRREVAERWGSNPLKYLVIALETGRRAANALAWTIENRVALALRQLKFNVLRSRLKSGAAWPAWLPRPTVREIYDAAEQRYRPPAPPVELPLIVLRASQGTGPDLPYREIFVEPDLGWGRHSQATSVVDVPGGHASMLQEPYVRSMAERLRTALAGKPRPQRQKDVVEA